MTLRKINVTDDVLNDHTTEKTLLNKANETVKTRNFANPEKT